MKPALIVGTDITANLIASQVTVELLKAGVEPVLVTTPGRPPRSSLDDRLVEQYFVERQLLQEVVFPTMGGVGAGDFYTPMALSERGAEVIRTKNVNGEKFLRSLTDTGVDVGVSLRCYQKFGKKITTLFRSHGALLNYHPGKLPEYRGVSTFVRSLANGDDKATYTLHHVTSDWDAGPVLAACDVELDTELPALANMYSSAPTAAAFLADQLLSYVDSVVPAGEPQVEPEAGYFTHPTPAELDHLERMGIRLVNVAETVEFLAEAYGGSEHSNELRLRMLAAASQRKSSQTSSQ